MLAVGLLSFFLLLASQPEGIKPGGRSEEPDRWLTRVRALIDAGRHGEAEGLLQDAIRRFPSAAEYHFWLGFALAKQGRWLESKKRFEQVIRIQPDHIGAHTELAGVEFKLSNNREAIRHLRHVLKLDPHDDYARRFLATVLYLEGDRLEVLHHWNEVGEPRIHQIQYRVPASAGMRFLQQLFPLNEGEVLRKEQVLAIRWKQTRFSLGPPFHWQVAPRPQGDWDLEAVLPPSSPFSTNRRFLLNNAVRAPIYREIRFQYPLTVGYRGRFEGGFRWERPRKRVHASGWFPFLSTSSDALGVGLDFRDERWRDDFSGTEFRFDTREARARYQYLLGGRKALSFNLGYQYQRLQLEEEASGTLPLDPHYFKSALEWNQRFGLNAADSLRLDWDSRFATFHGFGNGGSEAFQVSSRLQLKWDFKPESKSSLEFSTAGGYSGDNLPLDAYFILGIGQDGPLPLRAHPTVGGGQKGNSPMGRQFFLTNLEYHRELGTWKFLGITGKLFSDTGMIAARPFGDAKRAWFQDVGFGFDIGLLGRGLVEMLFGFNLQDPAFHFWVGIPVAR